MDIACQVMTQTDAELCVLNGYTGTVTADGRSGPGPGPAPGACPATRTGLRWHLQPRPGPTRMVARLEAGRQRSGGLGPQAAFRVTRTQQQ